MRVVSFLSLPKLEYIFFYVVILFLPTQLGKHFWPEFTLVSGMQIDYLSPTLYFTDILIALWAICWFINNRYSFIRHLVKQNAYLFVLFGSFVAYLFLTVLFSGNVFNGLYHLLKVLECAFVALGVATTVGKHVSLQAVATFFAVGIIGESILAISQSLVQGSVGGVLYFLGERAFTADTPGIANASINGDLILRAYGTFSHPNVLAGYLLVGMFIVLAFLFPGRRPWEKTLAFAALLLGTAAIIVTLSRVAMFLWFTVFIWFVLTRITGKSQQKFRTRRFGFNIVSMLLVLLFGGSFLLYTVVPRFLQTSFTEESIVLRNELNELAGAMITANPLFGVGLGNFLPTLAVLQSPLSYGFSLQPVHNIYLLITAEIGFVGLLFFVTFLSIVYKRIREMKRVFTALFLLILLLGVSDHYLLTLQQGQLLSAVVIGLCFASGKESFHLGTAKITRR